MKKVFTLFAVAAMALSASAEKITVELNPNQETTAISAANTVLFENEDLKVTNAYAGQGRTNNAYDYFDGEITLKGCVNVRGKKPSEDNVIGEIDKTDHSPLILEVKKAMTISGYVRTGDTKKLSLFRQSPFEEIAATPADGEKDSREGSDTRWCFTWSITPGTYTLTEIGGGGRFSGFIYEVSSTPAEPELPIAPSHTEGQEFTLSGDFPSGEFGTIMTPLAIDYEAKTLTFNEFLGGDATLTFKYEQRDPNAELTPNQTMFNLIPTSGATEAGSVADATAYDLDGLKNAAVAFKNNDVYTIKLNKPQLVGGTWSCMQYMTGNKFEITVYLSSQNQQWVNDNWGEASDMGYFRLIATVPASAAPTGIDDIVSGDENAPVEYYNLQGVRINEPAAGQVVIRRQGSKVAKIIVR